MASEVPSQCAVCGSDCSFTCSRCKGARYCSKDHQRQHWKTHKKTCFPPGSVCTRCQEPTASSPICRVPHPPHLLQGAGSMYSSEEVNHSFDCGACFQGFTVASSDREANISDMAVKDGPPWCYEGTHTIEPISGDRRVFKDVVQLVPGSLQDDIDGIDGDKVRVLKISSNGDFDGDSLPKLNRKLPALEELQIEDVDMSELVLNADLTPNLKVITLKNVSEECNFEIILPTLKEFHIFYHGPGEFGWILRMLENAPALVGFDSYKLRVGRLAFYSNHLKSIRLHRAELLTRVDLWAPALTSLDVQAAYDLEEIHFLDDHPLKAQLPANFVCNDELCVNAENACLGEQALQELNAHPRVVQTVSCDMDDGWQPPMGWA